MPDFAIEKDWWVTLAIRAIFDLPIGKHLVFKGGTSLSKGWQLIERFSEDIDEMIHGEAPSFDVLLQHLEDLTKRFSES